MSILEVGSGPGFITQRLLDEFPHATIVCVELDSEMATFARATLAPKYPAQRWHIVEASILNTDLEDDSVDFALARYVFQHLSAPDLAATEILRVLKPAGPLAVLDIDEGVGGFVVPSVPAFEIVSEKVRRTQARCGGDREIGRRLWRTLAEAGYDSLCLDALAFHSDELGLAAFAPQYDPRRYRAFVQEGSLTEEELEQYRQAYERFFSPLPDAFILQIALLASGRKPA